MSEETDKQIDQSNAFDPASTAKESAPADPRQGLPDTVKVETGPPLDLQPGDPTSKGPFVKYSGVATVRHIGPDDWKVLGIKSTNYFEWNYLNHKKIPVSKFNNEELQYLLKVDGRFSIVEK